LIESQSCASDWKAGTKSSRTIPSKIRKQLASVVSTNLMLLLPGVHSWALRQVFTGYRSRMSRWHVKPFGASGFAFAGSMAVKRILRPIIYGLAALYFLADAAFMTIAKPISDWLAKHVVLRQLSVWIRSLRPYPSLALFLVPVIILEPVKPVAAYLAATGRIASSVVTLIVGELVKLILVERLFRLTRDKLMKIPAFAWVYMKFREAKKWLKNTEAWKAIHRISKVARRYLAEMKKSVAGAFR
jgi:hypothetical protein